MLNITEITEQLNRYIRGEFERIDLLRKSLMEMRLRSGADIDPTARKFLSDFEGWYAEFTDNKTSEDFLRNRLRGRVSIIESLKGPLTQNKIEVYLAPDLTRPIESNPKWDCIFLSEPHQTDPLFTRTTSAIARSNAA